MIIWGSKPKEQEIGCGTFHCPNCDAQRSYKRMAVSRHFTLYFIPLFETGDAGEYVQCQMCNTRFDPGVLDEATISPAVVANWVAFMTEEGAKAALLLEQGTSAEQLKIDLLKAGVLNMTADIIVREAEIGRAGHLLEKGFSPVEVREFLLKAGRQWGAANDMMKDAQEREAENRRAKKH